MNHDIGIFFDVPMAEYRAADGINVSSLKEMAISPRHYLSALEETPEEPTEAQVIGTITHSAVLEDDFSGFVVRPVGLDARTKDGKEWIAAQRNPTIKQNIATNIAGMVNAVKNHAMATKILFGNRKNEVCCWKIHPSTGLLLKGRADCVMTDAKNQTVIADLKTCQRGDARESEFSKQIFQWGYDLQAAFYMDLFEASFFCFVCVEKESPFAVQCFNLSAEALAIGRRKYEGYLAKVRQCKESGVWDAYGDDLKTISLPDWVVRKENL